MSETPEMFLAKTISSEWEQMVRFALTIEGDNVDQVAQTVSEIAKVGYDSIRRKIMAIRYVGTLGHPQDDIIAMGQEVVLGTFQKSKRTQNYESNVVLKWTIPGSQRELVQKHEQRIKGVLGLVTSEDYWDWWLSQVENLSDQEIRDSVQKADPDEA